MRRTASAHTASLGVTHTQLAVQGELGWLFREQPTEDYGIDAQVEVVDGEVVEGRLLALQIKSGKTWFREPGPGGWWYRPDADHVRYWLNHSLPVAVVLVHPETELCHWELVNATTLVETSSGGWKILVPEGHLINATSRVALQEAAEGDPYALRLRELQLARPWVQRLAAGERLVIEIEEWINKTSGRGSITLGVDNEDGRDPERLASWGVFLGLSSYADVVPRLFAWRTSACTRRRTTRRTTRSTRPNAWLSMRATASWLASSASGSPTAGRSDFGLTTTRPARWTTGDSN